MASANRWVILISSALHFFQTGWLTGAPKVFSRVCLLWVVDAEGVEKLDFVPPAARQNRLLCSRLPQIVHSGMNTVQPPTKTGYSAVTQEDLQPMRAERGRGCSIQ